MADNVVANPGVGGATFAADDIGGVLFPRGKITIGADGVNDGDVSTSNPLPVTGTVAVTGVATAAKQDTGNTSLGTIAGAVAGTEMQVDVLTMPTVTVTGAGGTFPVTDSGGSITVDAPQGTPVFVRLSDGANPIATLPVSLASVPSHAVTNAGTFAVQVDGNALTALQLIDDPVIADDAAFTPATSKVMMAGFQADESSTDSVDEGDAGAARMTLDRKVLVNPQPHTAGGLTTFMASGSDGSTILVATAQAAKASAGQLYGYYLYNPEAAVTFVHFYDVAQGSVTVGTTNPLFSLQIPAASAANLMGTMGILFATAITIAATTTAGGNTAPATGVSATLWFK